MKMCVNGTTPIYAVCSLTAAVTAPMYYRWQCLLCTSPSANSSLWLLHLIHVLEDFRTPLVRPGSLGYVGLSSW